MMTAVEAEKHNNTHDFDVHVLDVISIIVSYDMGWSKRGNGKAYNSQNGYGAIIGLLSGKVLDYRTRNRNCAMCAKGHDPTDHRCHRNLDGSAKAMEGDAAADLINQSEFLEKEGMSVRGVIGDEDAVAIENIRKGNKKKIFKFADSNHLKKNFVSKLYDLKKKHREFKKKSTIVHIKKLFNFAVHQNKKNTEGLQNTLRSLPDHLFGDHNRCASWCSSSKLSKIEYRKFHAITFKDKILYKDLKNLFESYAANAHKFSITAMSQRNECLNSLIVHHFPKNKNFSCTQQGDIRVRAGVMHFNAGYESTVRVKNVLNHSPGVRTKKFAKNADRHRLKQTQRQATKSAKCRRSLLKIIREKIRVTAENSEGPTYKTDTGIDNFIIPEKWEVSQHKVIDDYIVVYYDFETSSLEVDSADVVQIAAKAGDSEFSLYVTPTQNIDEEASAATKLTNVGPKLFYNNVEVETVSQSEAFQAFKQFIKTLKKNAF